MTRLPLEDRQVTGLIEGPPYEENLVCPVPGCGLRGTEGHHLWRRSFLAGDYPYVTLPDGSVVANVVLLCNQHHHMVTVNAAWVKLEDGVFTWSDLVNASQPLTWQPPIWREDERRVSSDGDHPGGDPDPADPDLRRDHVAHDGTCPTCLRPLPHKRDTSEAKRIRRTWSVTVPKDEREDGAETLDTLLEEARKEMARAGLPYGDEETVKFFVLAAALGLFVSHAEDVLA